MRIAVVGKGGAGKSVFAGSLARIVARAGRDVLALDSDLMPGLALSLGAVPPADPPLLEAAERGDDGRWRLHPGVGPATAVRRYSTLAPDGVRLLQCGKFGPGGTAPIMPALQAFYIIVQRLARERPLRDWLVVGDLPAGPRQTAFNWAPYAKTFVILAEPTWKSALTARRVMRLVLARGADPVLVGSKVSRRSDLRRLERMLAAPLQGAVPADDAVRAAEAEGAALLDYAPRSKALRAIERLTAELVPGIR